ncbi:MAG: hypothetical protein QF596_03525 [Acidimicrobiales bacterium]|jgi:hypothetical protein|nr:hypothetical protein [Acidimicrobiales bacterium]MDP6299018.1 hypothetical protein [Acidimicrobiales bacterium]HJM27520.1 DUF3303 family protein [Acidimicrobiales bacterium]HJM97910.1 DUF3303 family protein [Acidimicrobiales bacterium]
MIFHVTHTHNELTCPIHDPETLLNSFGKALESLENESVNIIGAWVDGPGHQLFFVIETDSADAIHNGLKPIIDRGTARIQPVTDMQARIQDIAAGN